LGYGCGSSIVKSGGMKSECGLLPLMIRREINIGGTVR